MARVLGPSVELAQDVVRSTEVAPGKLSMLYGAEFYRTERRGLTTVVEPVSELNKKFKADNLVHLSEHDKWVQGPKARFSTVAEVKALLTKMGLKQSPQ